MAIKKHLFIAPTGQLLPRWKEAFPKAVGASVSQLPSSNSFDFIWLRLQPGVAVELQINQLQSFIGRSALLILSDIPDDNEGLLAFSAAAKGYGNSHATAELLRQMARVVEQGGLWIGESLMQRLLVGVSNLPQPVAKVTGQVYKLTSRELEVAKAVAAGASNKDIARQLTITERTVKAHISGLFGKLGVSDRLQLALKMRDMS